MLYQLWFHYSRSLYYRQCEGAPFLSVFGQLELRNAEILKAVLSTSASFPDIRMVSSPDKSLL